MYLNYTDLIQESVEELACLEKRHRADPLADRLKMLRLLKSKAYRSRRPLAHLLGYSERQLQRWFDQYRQGGLKALIKRPGAGGSAERISPEAWKALESQMKAGEIARLNDAQRFLREHFTIGYSIGGLSHLFQRRKTKLKTGRPRNKKAQAAQQAAFKKTVSC